ncbi:hypothetical protein uav_130 [Pseudomonas phage UAVern]|uniref:Uncharacterized protein n=1 Tax=Pseudomonas phage UAVern TaxID=2856997 RepID=A0A975UUA7_9CAUD|nr:hypothetical protein uav_130 [Pseudomonas phage UAVern]
MSEAKDVSGKVLNVGDKVAYCLGGKGTVMRVGEVLRMTAKSVIIGGSELRYNWTARQHQMEVVETIRAFDAVSKVEVAA